MLDLRPRRLDLTGVRKSILQLLVRRIEISDPAAFIDCPRELLLVILDPHGSKKKTLI